MEKPILFYLIINSMTELSLEQILYLGHEKGSLFLEEKQVFTQGQAGSLKALCISTSNSSVGVKNGTTFDLFVFLLKEVLWA